MACQALHYNTRAPLGSATMLILKTGIVYSVFRFKDHLIRGIATSSTSYDTIEIRAEL